MIKKAFTMFGLILFTYIVSFFLVFDVTHKAYCLTENEMVFQTNIISNKYNIQIGEKHSLSEGVNTIASKLKQVGNYFSSKYKGDKLLAPVPRWFDGNIDVQKVSFLHYFYYPMIKIFI